MEHDTKNINPKVVIIGGGIGGAFVAKNMQCCADVSLIDAKEYFEIPWARLRSRVEPAVAERAVFNHSEYLTNGKIITSTALTVTETDVLTSEGRLLPYDYLVIATGLGYAIPRNKRDRIEQFLEDNQKIKSSASILIIGGGPSGVELAGEIAIDYPDKKVTLVHHGHRLLEFIGPKAGNKALEWLRSKRVEVLLDQSVDLRAISEADRTYTTSSGETINADCHFVCVRKPIGSSWLHGSCLKDYLDRKGNLMLDENLRVGGLKNIFAVGDITDVPEIKQGMAAQRHAMVVTKNLKLLTKGASDSKLVKYKPSSATAMVSLGRRDCIAQFPIATISGFLPGMIRSRDLFVSRTRRQLGLQSHPPA